MAVRSPSYSKTRIIAENTIQTVVAVPCILRRLVINNLDVAIKTVTITDGAAVQHVISCPAAAPYQVDLDIDIDTSLKITPEDADLDILVIWEAV